MNKTYKWAPLGDSVRASMEGHPGVQGEPPGHPPKKDRALPPPPKKKGLSPPDSELPYWGSWQEEHPLPQEGSKGHPDFSLATPRGVPSGRAPTQGSSRTNETFEVTASPKVKVKEFPRAGGIPSYCWLTGRPRAGPGLGWAPEKPRSGSVFVWETLGDTRLGRD